MPQASKHLQNRIIKRFGSLNDEGPSKFLEERGFVLSRDWQWSHPTIKNFQQMSNEEFECLDFLMAEHDYGGFIPKTLNKQEQKIIDMGLPPSFIAEGSPLNPEILDKNPLTPTEKLLYLSLKRLTEAANNNMIKLQEAIRIIKILWRVICVLSVMFLALGCLELYRIFS